MSEQKEQGLEVLIDRYWDLAYAEGKEGRATDTPNDDAMDTRYAIDTALEAQAAEIAELRAEVERKTRRADMIEKSAGFATDEVARLEDENKALKARALAAETALATAREDILEEAAKVCEQKAAEAWQDYKHGDGPERGDPHYQGMSDGADDCERLIRALKTKEPSHG